MAPVPPRIDADAKIGLLELLDAAVTDGWSVTRECRVLELDERRARRWRARRDDGDVSMMGCPDGPCTV